MALDAVETVSLRRVHSRHGLVPESIACKVLFRGAAIPGGNPLLWVWFRDWFCSHHLIPVSDALGLHGTFGADMIDRSRGCGIQQSISLDFSVLLVCHSFNADIARPRVGHSVRCGFQIDDLPICQTVVHIFSPNANSHRKSA